MGHSNNFEDLFLTIFFAYVSEVSVGVLSSMNGIIGKMRSHETLVDDGSKKRRMERERE